MFTQLPVEHHIPDNVEFVFVQDFFVTEVLGGAEMTSDAIIRACPTSVYEIHASSLTEALIKRHRAKTWIFGNQTLVQPHLLYLFIELGIPYFFFEYDYKPCVMRSTKKHGDCSCNQTDRGQFMAYWMTNAKTLFWCSGGQRDKFYGEFPQFHGKTVDFVQGSTFYPETILGIRAVREKGGIVKKDRWVILDSESWIKGTSDAIAHCKANDLNFVLLKGLTNERFLEELACSKGLVFLPRDMDVGSRITVETKLLGGELIVNDNVLPAKEPWFNRPTEEIEAYFLDGPDRFWRQVFQARSS